MHAVVVGAGVFGLAVATELVERGVSVTLCERNAGLGGNASWLAGGMLAPFCEGESAPPGVVERGRSALDWWARHTPVTRNGTLVVAPPRDAPDLERFSARTQGWGRVNEAEIAGLEPDLAGRFRKGLFFADEGHVDPRAAMTALRDGLIRNGADVRFGHACGPSVPSPLVGEGQGGGSSRMAPSPHPNPPPRGGTEALADGVVVDCRGFAARADLPGLRGVRGEMALVRTREVRLSRPVRLLHPRIPLYVVPRANGVFMIGATMIESAERGGVTARSAIELFSAAFALHPAFGEAEILEMRADVRPAYSDNEPRVIARNGRIFVNGAYRHGYLLAPDMAAQGADMAVAAARVAA